MDFVARVSEIVKFAWGPIGRRIGYIKNLKKNIKELNKNAEYLFAARNDEEYRINNSLSVVASKVCEKWLEDVKEAKDDVDKINEEYDKENKCLAGWCLNVCNSMKLGKRVEEVYNRITNLRSEQLTFAGRELVDAPCEKFVPQSAQNVETSSSADPTLQKILEFIDDTKVQKIGIVGMGGIGKTRTMELLNDQLGPKFDITIFVTVSGEGNEGTVQRDIANRLKLKVSNESAGQLKIHIHRHLSGKKFLLILDDIWGKIDLSHVGIPNLNQADGCKVVLATREFGICQRMGTDKTIQMEKLPYEKAWSLFKEKVGVRNVPMSPHIEPIAIEIVEKCGGLPLAIIVIGSSLREVVDADVWRNTLEELKSPPTSQIDGMEKEVFSCLMLSYRRLTNDCEKRNLFLYCSLYPEDSQILKTELVERCWLEDYIQGADSIEKAQDRGHHILSNLVNASLLEKGYTDEHIKMHDIVRIFALNEASSFLAKTGKHVKHPPEEKDWLQAQKISLMGCSFRNLLLERPNCGNLTTLLLQHNYELTIIPDSFFEYMHSLRILDLSVTKIESLPSSLWNLVNLRGLYLRGCKNLKELPSQVGALKGLEVLDLGGIRYLPKEGVELTGLKRLKINFEMHSCSQTDEDTREWKMKLRVPTGIFPNLPKMEELSLLMLDSIEDHFHVFWHDCVEKEQWDDESMEVVVDELCRLEHLTHLDTYFPKVESLERFLSYRKSVKASWFRSFRFRVGTEKSRFDPKMILGQNSGRNLLYKGGVGMSHAAITETLAHCSFFLLQDHQTARNLLEFGPANMNELEGCRVIGCDKMETLFDRDGEQQTCALLPNLKHLEIWDLPNLRSLCVGRLFNGTLSKLTDLNLDRCPKLKTVFQLSIIRQLCSLKFLWVGSCSMVEEIIEVEEEMSVASNDKVILPNIQLIYLWNLPELVSMCRGFCNFEWPSLETIEITRCPKLKSLSFLSHGTNIVAHALKNIRGENEWWEALESEDSGIKQQLLPFFRQAPSYY